MIDSRAPSRQRVTRRGMVWGLITMLTFNIVCGAPIYLEMISFGASWQLHARTYSVFALLSLCFFAAGFVGSWLWRRWTSDARSRF